MICSKCKRAGNHCSFQGPKRAYNRKPKVAETRKRKEPLSAEFVESEEEELEAKKPKIKIDKPSVGGKRPPTDVIAQLKGLQEEIVSGFFEIERF